MQTAWKLESQELDPLNDVELTEPIKQVLIKRNIVSSAQVHDFLNPSLEHLTDPFLMKGIREAVNRIRQNMQTQKKVLLHGDYDADGITSCAVLSHIMAALGIPYRAFMPHRVTDGYGVSSQAIHQAAEEGCDLMITADCGTNAKEEIELAKRLGLDVIVIDHHTIQADTLANPTVLINPERPDCTYPYKGFASCGLSFKLGQALLGVGKMREVLDVVALGTVCDMSPLTGENRVLVTYGLQKLASQPTVGLEALVKASRIRAKQFKASHFGFALGPRINASGRMGTPETAYRLLVTRNPAEAESLANALDAENRSRQKVEAKIVRDAVRQVEQDFNFQEDHAIVVWNPEWHQGVVGIVAARLIERFWRPSIVLAVDEATGIAKGSGRSIHSINLVSVLEKCQDKLTTFGGHEQAVGLSLHVDSLKPFCQSMNDYLRSIISQDHYVKPIHVDVEVDLSQLTTKMLTECDRLQPFGLRNPKPTFLTRGLELKAKQTTTSTRWSAWVTDGHFVYEANWSKPRYALEDIMEMGKFDLVYSISQKTFFGETHLRLEIVDLKPVSSVVL